MSVQTTARDERHRVLVGVALCAVAGMLWAVAGIFGLVAGAITIALWYAFGIPYAIALGHVMLLGLFPDGIGLAQFVLIETAFLAVLLAHVVDFSNAGQFGGAVLVSVLLLGGGTWLAFHSHSRWLAAGVFLALLASGMYGLHRYERIALGLVPAESNARPDQGATGGQET